MANALPLLVLGGAAVLLLGGKKKKKKSSKPATLSGYSPEAAAHSPPALTPTAKSKGSGYSNVSREQMQWIQTTLAALGYDVGPKGMDGLYGPATKAAVWAFQEDHHDALGEPDGKPGPNTQARLAEVQNARGEAQSQGEYPQDECDPLDPSTWGSGNMCVIEDGRWVRVSAAPSPSSSQPSSSNGFPAISSSEVAFNLDGTSMQMGPSWRYAILDQWLNGRRLNGMLQTKFDEVPPDVFMDNHPDWEERAELAWNEIGVEEAGVIAGMWATIAFTTAELTSLTLLAAGAIALTPTVMLVVGTLWYQRARYEEFLFQGEDREIKKLMLLTSGDAFGEFIATHYVRTPAGSVLIANLPVTTATKDLLMFIADEIARFQSSSFD